MNASIAEIPESFSGGPNLTAFVAAQSHLRTKIIGQDTLVDRLLIALLADGHLLVEGPPGIAKTRAIKELSYLLEGDFHRLQFTPDLLPGDLTGTDVYRPDSGEFVFQPGPVFHNLVLADEINRAPAKVQSALLEAMEEKQVTIGKHTYPLPSPFLVMATQNPIEQEGTYVLPEAQLDRFLMHVLVDYPVDADERRILELVREETGKGVAVRPPSTLNAKTVEAARAEVIKIHMAAPVQEYIVQLVLATRHPDRYSDELARMISFGASPRATIALDRCARADAWLKGREFVSPENVQAVLFDTLRHRVLLSFEAEAAGHTADDFLRELVRHVPVA